MDDTIADAKDYFEALHELGKKFCTAVGLNDDLPIQIYQSENDWAFILQIDALHELTCREIALRIPEFKIGDKVIAQSERRTYLDRLPINGKKSILKLLESNGVQFDILDFIGHVRKIRNTYAHDIRNINTPLLSTIQRQSDASHILSSFSSLRPDVYTEEVFLEMLSRGSRMLRFCILIKTLRFLTLAILNINEANKAKSSEI